MERLTRLLAIVALLAGLVVVTPVARAADATFGTPTATAAYGTSVTFEQPVTTGDVSRAEVLVRFQGELGPMATPVPPPADGSSTLRHTLLVTEGHILPNTTITAAWRLTFRDGTSTTGPEVRILYADDRFDWRTEAGDLVRVHWYEGDDAFGKRALRIGEDAIAKAEDLLGVKETAPIDFFIYADQAAFYDALGPGTRENVGGQANPDIRTLFALITPAEIDDPWVGIVVPHELTHLVFDTAVENPYHAPPRWLDEGLAVYLSQGYDASDRRLVKQAAMDGTLIPLVGLIRAFPTTRDGFFLAYAESVSAVDYLERTYGEDALVELIRSYPEGRTDDEAFSAALGVDTTAFNEAWFASVGASVPPAIGPKPAPAGPLPPGWTGAGTTPGPGASGEPAPTATPAPGGQGGIGDDAAVLAAVVLSAAVVTGAGLAGWMIVRRRRAIGLASVAAESGGAAPPAAAPAPATHAADGASHGPDP